MDVCVKLTIKGRVQGVGFRWFAQKEARRLGVNGYVKNLLGGDVEIEAEGEQKSIDEFIHQMRKGPAFSHVTDVLTEWREYRNKYDTFQVAF